VKKKNKNLGNAIQKVKIKMESTQKPILVALDGRSGTGKTTIAKEISKELGGVVIASDDFWVGGSDDIWFNLKPKERADKAIDWRRLRSDVLDPLLRGEHAVWHPFDWKRGYGLAEENIKCPAAKLIILDGAYSSRPELRDIIDISILVKTPDDSDRRVRLIKREGEEYMKNWHEIWDSAEDYYFTNVRPEESFDLIIENGSN
jgi:uridine kinase